MLIFQRLTINKFSILELNGWDKTYISQGQYLSCTNGIYCAVSIVRFIHDVQTSKFGCSLRMSSTYSAN